MANLLGEEIPQIWALCGRGSRSSLRVLRPGLAVTEMAVSPLPGAPQAVFTVRRSRTDEFDAYIVVSFTNATLVDPASALDSSQISTNQLICARPAVLSILPAAKDVEIYCRPCRCAIWLQGRDDHLVSNF